jgi:hypothetical protein
MKLVAIRKFHNSKRVGLKLDSKTPNFEHELEVPKGHRFDLGGEAKTLKGVVNDSDKELIARLVSSKAVIVDDGSPEAQDYLKQLDREVAAEAAVRKAQAKVVPPI